jgi:sarcosine oxidase, subunit gamma
MVETALRREPLDRRMAVEVKSRLAIAAAPPAARFVLRGPQAAVRAACDRMGLALPEAINRATSDNDRAAFMLGPDEWLLIAPDGFTLAPPNATEPCSIVDVSHRNTGIAVSGTLAPDVLSSGVMLDLDEAAFPIGMATRTLFAKAEIVLWRRRQLEFHIEVWRSFAPYLDGLLREAAREFVRQDANQADLS